MKLADIKPDSSLMHVTHLHCCLHPLLQGEMIRYLNTKISPTNKDAHMQYSTREHNVSESIS